MMSDPKPHAYAVTITLEGGVAFTNLLVAPSTEEAAVVSGVMAGRGTEGNVLSVSIVEIPADWLRRTLRMVEGDAKPSVVSLVSDNPRGPPETPGEILFGPPETA